MKYFCLVTLIGMLLLPTGVHADTEKLWSVDLIQAGEFKPKPPTGKYLGPFTEGIIDIMSDRATMPYSLRLYLGCKWVDETGRGWDGGGRANVIAFSPQMAEELDKAIRKSGKPYAFYELYPGPMQQIGFFHYADRFGAAPWNIFFFTGHLKPLQNPTQCKQAEQEYRKAYPDK